MPTVQSSPTPSPTKAQAPSSSPVAPIAISVSIIFVVLIIGLIMFLHFRRQSKKNLRASPVRKGREVQAGETVSRTHPAALMITPADGNGVPRFVHTPGTNMRIASRRPDGAWEFSDPRAPFTPSIIADPEDAAPRANRNSIGSDEGASIVRAPSSLADNSPYSHASYRSETSAPGSTSELIPPPTASSASPWGPPVTPHTASSHGSVHSPWRSVYSPSPSTAASTFLPAPSIATSSRRNSTVSSNDSFLDLDPDSRSTHSGSNSSNPFLSPAPSIASHRAPTPASPLRSPPVSASPKPASPAPSTPATPSRSLSPHPRPAESRVAREIRLGYEELDRRSAAPDEPSAVAGSSSLEPPMTTAARAKEAESRAARVIRQGYETVDRTSEYAEYEDLPRY